MVHPRKKVREVLFSIHPLSYRIVSKPPDQETMDKKLFIEVLRQMREIDDRTDFLGSEIGMDMTAYEEQFFAVIDNLMKMHFSKEQLALIQLYLYQLVPDKEWDGTISITPEGQKETIVPFKEPEEVWNVIKKFNK